MAPTISWLSILILMMLTACGYAVATVGMKMSAGMTNAATTAIIVLGLAGAAFAEIALLRNASLPTVYIGIILGETILVLGYAAWDQHTLSLQQLGGAALVIAGFALVSSHD